MPELRGRLTPQGNLGGTLNTIVYASNYNALDNKPSINSVTLQGNKTASDLGLATPSDITVTSVNGETGAVVLDGSDINYDANTTVNSKLDDLQSQIENSGVLAVNGKTGVVTLTGTDINYSAGVTLNAKINAVEAEIPTVDYPVTSVNGETGAVVLDGSDINYDANTTINAKINAVEAEIPTVDYPVTSVNGETGAVVLDGSDINYDTNMTVNAKIDAVEGNIPTTDNDISHYTGTPTAGSTAEAINKASEYKSGDSVSFTTSGKALYAPCVYASSTEVRLFLALPKKPTTCTVSLSYFEVYCNGRDDNQTSNVSTVTATEKENGIFLKITGNFTSPQVNYIGLAVMQGTITFT